MRLLTPPPRPRRTLLRSRNVRCASSRLHNIQSAAFETLLFAVVVRLAERLYVGRV